MLESYFVLNYTTLMANSIWTEFHFSIFFFIFLLSDQPCHDHHKFAILSAMALFGGILINKIELQVNNSARKQKLLCFSSAYSLCIFDIDINFFTSSVINISHQQTVSPDQCHQHKPSANCVPRQVPST